VHRTVNKVQGCPLLSVFLDIRLVLSIRIDMDECTIHQTFVSFYYLHLVKAGTLPLLQAHEMISSCTLVQKGRDTKPACLPVVGGSIAGRQRVTHHLASRTGVDKLRVSAEAANDLHTGKRGAWRSRERPRRGGGGEPREAAECRLWEHFEMRFATEGGRVVEFEREAMMAIAGDGEGELVQFYKLLDLV
jgi:hypothetical protein